MEKQSRKRKRNRSNKHKSSAHNTTADNCVQFAKEHTKTDLTNSISNHQSIMTQSDGDQDGEKFMNLRINIKMPVSSTEKKELISSFVNKLKSINPRATPTISQTDRNINNLCEFVMPKPIKIENPDESEGDALPRETYIERIKSEYGINIEEKCRQSLVKGEDDDFLSIISDIGSSTVNCSDQVTNYCGKKVKKITFDKLERHGSFYMRNKAETEAGNVCLETSILENIPDQINNEPNDEKELINNIDHSNPSDKELPNNNLEKKLNNLEIDNSILNSSNIDNHENNIYHTENRDTVQIKSVLDIEEKYKVVSEAIENITISHCITPSLKEKLVGSNLNFDAISTSSKHLPVALEGNRQSLEKCSVNENNHSSKEISDTEKSSNIITNKQKEKIVNKILEIDEHLFEDDSIKTFNINTAEANVELREHTQEANDNSLDVNIEETSLEMIKSENESHTEECNFVEISPKKRRVDKDKVSSHDESSTFEDKSIRNMSITERRDFKKLRKQRETMAANDSTGFINSNDAMTTHEIIDIVMDLYNSHYSVEENSTATQLEKSEQVSAINLEKSENQDKTNNVLVRKQSKENTDETQIKNDIINKELSGIDNSKILENESVKTESDYDSSEECECYREENSAQHKYIFSDSSSDGLVVGSKKNKVNLNSIVSDDSSNQLIIDEFCDREEGASKQYEDSELKNGNYTPDKLSKHPNSKTHNSNIISKRSPDIESTSKSQMVKKIINQSRKQKSNSSSGSSSDSDLRAPKNNNKIPNDILSDTTSEDEVTSLKNLKKSVNIKQRKRRVLNELKQQKRIKSYILSSESSDDEENGPLPLKKKPLQLDKNSKVKSIGNAKSTTKSDTPLISNQDLQPKSIIMPEIVSNVKENTPTFQKNREQLNCTSTEMETGINISKQSKIENSSSENEMIKSKKVEIPENTLCQNNSNENLGNLKNADKCRTDNTHSPLKELVSDHALDNNQKYAPTKSKNTSNITYEINDYNSKLQNIPSDTSSDDDFTISIQNSKSNDTLLNEKITKLKNSRKFSISSSSDSETNVCSKTKEDSNNSPYNSDEELINWRKTLFQKNNTLHLNVDSRKKTNTVNSAETKRQKQKVVISTSKAIDVKNNNYNNTENENVESESIDDNMSAQEVLDIVMNVYDSHYNVNDQNEAKEDGNLYVNKKDDESTIANKCKTVSLKKNQSKTRKSKIKSKDLKVGNSSTVKNKTDSATNDECAMLKGDEPITQGIIVETPSYKSTCMEETLKENEGLTSLNTKNIMDKSGHKDDEINTQEILGIVNEAFSAIDENKGDDHSESKEIKNQTKGKAKTNNKGKRPLKTKNNAKQEKNVEHNNVEANTTTIQKQSESPTIDNKSDSNSNTHNLNIRRSPRKSVQNKTMDIGSISITEKSNVQMEITQVTKKTADKSFPKMHKENKIDAATEIAIENIIKESESIIKKTTEVMKPIKAGGNDTEERNISTVHEGATSKLPNKRKAKEKIKVKFDFMKRRTRSVTSINKTDNSVLNYTQSDKSLNTSKDAVETELNENNSNLLNASDSVEDVNIENISPEKNVPSPEMLSKISLITVTDKEEIPNNNIKSPRIGEKLHNKHCEQVNEQTQTEVLTTENNFESENITPSSQVISISKQNIDKKCLTIKHLQNKQCNEEANTQHPLSTELITESNFESENIIPSSQVSSSLKQLNGTVLNINETKLSYLSNNVKIPIKKQNTTSSNSSSNISLYSITNEEEIQSSNKKSSKITEKRCNEQVNKQQQMSIELTSENITPSSPLTNNLEQNENCQVLQSESNGTAPLITSQEILQQQNEPSLTRNTVKAAENLNNASRCVAAEASKEVEGDPCVSLLTLESNVEEFMAGFGLHSNISSESLVNFAKDASISFSTSPNILLSANEGEIQNSNKKSSKIKEKQHNDRVMTRQQRFLELTTKNIIPSSQLTNSLKQNEKCQALQSKRKETASRIISQEILHRQNEPCLMENAAEIAESTSKIRDHQTTRVKNLQIKPKTNNASLCAVSEASKQIEADPCVSSLMPNTIDVEGGNGSCLNVITTSPTSSQNQSNNNLSGTKRKLTNVKHCRNLTKRYKAQRSGSISPAAKKTNQQLNETYVEKSGDTASSVSQRIINKKKRKDKFLKLVEKTVNVILNRQKEQKSPAKPKKYKRIINMDPEEEIMETSSSSSDEDYSRRKLKKRNSSSRSIDYSVDERKELVIECLDKLKTTKLHKNIENNSSINDEVNSSSEDSEVDAAEISGEFLSTVKEARMHMQALTCAHERLKNLKIRISFEIPKAHEIAVRLTGRPSKVQQQKLAKSGIKIRDGHFTEKEDFLIYTNFSKFCEAYNLENDPTPFLNLGVESVLPYTEKLNFVRYIGRGLPDRYLFAIHLRFQKLMSTRKTGCFTVEEDEILLKYGEMMNKKKSKMAALEFILRRPKKCILKRYEELKA